MNLSSPNPSPPSLSWCEERPQSAAFSDIAEALASCGIPFRFKALGRSMYPAILNGDMLHVEPLGQRDLKTGDIVLFKSNGKFKAHRIVRINGDHFIARGDASLDSDGVVRRPQILGRVTAKECRNTGKLVALAGLAARAHFQFRRVRSSIGRTLRRLVATKDPVLAFIARSRPDN